MFKRLNRVSEYFDCLSDFLEYLLLFTLSGSVIQVVIFRYYDSDRKFWQFLSLIAYLSFSFPQYLEKKE